MGKCGKWKELACSIHRSANGIGPSCRLWCIVGATHQVFEGVGVCEWMMEAWVEAEKVKGVHVPDQVIT